MTKANTGFTLRWLLDGITDAPPLPVAGISTDSRRLEPGDVFLAYQGAGTHGLEFIDQAIAAGVAAIVWESTTAVTPESRAGVVMVPVPQLADRLGELANRWFHSPSERMKVSGVTGTNGKTTVAFLIARCMQLLERPCAYMGTLGAGITTLDHELGLTTPGCVDLHRKLAEFVTLRAGYTALEVSSHALHQKRIDGVHFDSVLFTNLSRDHIDYHGDMEAYGETKARFIMDGNVAHRIVTVDSEFGRRLANRCVDQRADNVIAVSTQAEGDSASMTHVHMQANESDEKGSTVDVRSSWGSTTFRLPLAGYFNVANAALVLAQLLGWDTSLADATNALSRVLPPPGRMQRVQPGSAPVVYVDYAHTPAGLEAVLGTLRNHGKGALWCVFGCGGDRDQGKRAEMGKVVARLADRAVVTSDNPRNEEPGEIIRAVLHGMPPDTIAMVAIEDRAAAIDYAIAGAEDGDIVLIAGKGHEDYQVIGDTRRPFSDYDVALESLRRRNAARRPA
jgi:UDP-N-acetylmuramoyl-L-alanyl-D-glutamate--2,6-diaminopimelate ligase